MGDSISPSVKGNNTSSASKNGNVQGNKKVTNFSNGYVLSADQQGAQVITDGNTGTVRGVRNRVRQRVKRFFQPGGDDKEKKRVEKETVSTLYLNSSSTGQFTL